MQAGTDTLFISLNQKMVISRRPVVHYSCVLMWMHWSHALHSSLDFRSTIGTPGFVVM